MRRGQDGTDRLRFSCKALIADRTPPLDYTDVLMKTAERPRWFLVENCMSALSVFMGVADGFFATNESIMPLNLPSPVGRLFSP